VLRSKANISSMGKSRSPSGRSIKLAKQTNFPGDPTRSKPTRRVRACKNCRGFLPPQEFVAATTYNPFLSSENPSLKPGMRRFGSLLNSCQRLHCGTHRSGVPYLAALTNDRHASSLFARM